MSRFRNYVFFLLLAGAASAAEKPIVDFRIAAQPLATALIELSKQAHIQVLTAGYAVEGVAAGDVAGRLTVDAAVARMLKGSGFTYRFVDEKTLILVKEAVGKSTASAIYGGGGVKVAQADFQDSSQSTDGSSSAAPAENSASSDDTKLEEIIVTAQKRRERLIDVPISIVALGAEELKRRQITSLDDLPFAVPGLAIQSNGANRSIILRGISNNIGAVGTDMPLIGMYLDEVDVTLGAFYQINPGTYDLERVEVLRGPQGTLYGEGSAGGTIRFITHDPDLSGFAMAADAAALFTDGGDPGQRVNAMLNLPLSEGTFGVRFAGTFAHEGGWIDQPAAEEKDINGQDLTNVRVKALWKPSEQLAVSAMAQIYRNDLSTSTGEDSHGNYTQVFGLTTAPKMEDKNEVYNLTLTYDLGVAQLINATSYVRARNDARNVGFQYQFFEPGTPDSLYHYLALRARLDDRVLENELRLTSKGDDRWRWTLGAIYRNFRDDFENPEAYSAPAGASPGVPFSYASYYRFKDWSVFGDVSYQLTRQLSLGVGARYFSDDQEFEAFGSTQSGTFHSVDPRLYVQYKLADSTNLYASAAKGFRSGGFNILPQMPTFDPEDIRTYELGAKALLGRGRLRADLSIFHSDYSDYQVVGVAPPPNTVFGSIASNAGDARIRGVEWSLNWSPGKQWALGFSGTYLDTEFRKINAAFTAYQVGDELDGVPKHQFVVTGQRDFSWQGKAGFIRLDYNEQGRKTLRNRSIGPWYHNQSDVVDLLNLNASLWWSRSLRLGVFAQNLLDDRGFLSPGSIELNAARSRPRTFGIEFGVTFD